MALKRAEGHGISFLKEEILQPCPSTFSVIYSQVSEQRIAALGVQDVILLFFGWGGIQFNLFQESLFSTWTKQHYDWRKICCEFCLITHSKGKTCALPLKHNCWCLKLKQLWSPCYAWGVLFCLMLKVYVWICLIAFPCWRDSESCVMHRYMISASVQAKEMPWAIFLLERNMCPAIHLSLTWWKTPV